MHEMRITIAPFVPEIQGFKEQASVIVDFEKTRLKRSLPGEILSAVFSGYW